MTRISSRLPGSLATPLPRVAYLKNDRVFPNGSTELERQSTNSKFALTQSRQQESEEDQF